MLWFCVYPRSSYDLDLLRTSHDVDVVALSSLDARRTTWVSRDGSFFLFSPGIKSLCKSLNIQLVEITETVYGSGNRVVLYTYVRLPFLFKLPRRPLAPARTNCNSGRPTLLHSRI